MMATTHILAGAAVARLLRHPRWAWPGAFVSYFVLEAIPHVNIEQYLAYPQRGWASLVDVCVGLMVFALLARGKSDARLMIGGVAIVLLVGITKNASLLLLWFSRLTAHPLFPHASHIVGVLTQLAVLAWAISVLRRPAGQAGALPRTAV